MGVWQFIDGIIRNPPRIVLAILVAILVAHVLKMTFEFISNRKQPNSLIITLELIVVIVLASLTAHLYFERAMTVTESHGTLTETLLMVILLIFFTLISMVVYIFFRAAIKDD
jgi:hypothetical protein